MRNLVVLIGVIALCIHSFAMAEKPAGKESKAKMHEQTEMKHAEKKMEQHNEKEMKQHAEKEMKDDDDAAMMKNKVEKTEQERKELGKGSEQGQAAREEHSRKWWKFWE